MNTIIEKAKAVQKNNKLIAGSFCSFVPIEILDAAEIYLLNIGSKDEKNSAMAEGELPANLCPIIKSSYGDALSKDDNLINLVDLIIAEMSCDGKKKMFERLGEFKDIIAIQLPQGTDRPYATIMWENEVRYLIKCLEEKYGLTITETKLKTAT